MFATRGNRKTTTNDKSFVSTIYPRSPHNDWREIAIYAKTQEEADTLAARVQEGGYTGIFLVSPAHASARLVDEQGRVFRIGHWPQKDQPDQAATG